MCYCSELRGIFYVLKCETSVPVKCGGNCLAASEVMGTVGDLIGRGTVKASFP